ncbi:hypothetical protein VIGAN_09088700 [Vigna angularis var. angularis]|uniref:Uncharacterized protein n=1 Tax=Vigna angularis var. angularis TaxID=157739 RepID=A0A0S3SX30_PHAAN|nr:hypothetical protein VIGAN_09088700 [Vigna angularis var. angularis]
MGDDLLFYAFSRFISFSRFLDSFNNHGIELSAMPAMPAMVEWSFFFSRFLDCFNNHGMELSGSLHLHAKLPCHAGRNITEPNTARPSEGTQTWNRIRFMEPKTEVLPEEGTEYAAIGTEYGAVRDLRSWGTEYSYAGNRIQLVCEWFEDLEPNTPTMESDTARV